MDATLTGLLAAVLVPGFSVTELPVELTNRNNLRYREDGALYALGYNGSIHLLRDTDGDGLEDEAAVFWDRPGTLRGPIGMAVTPPGYPRGRGVFVASKGKLSLIVDRDGDDRADEEIVVASGWPELPVSVDAVGCAIDPADGSIVFGLGCGDFSNAYRIDGEGRSRYEIGDVHGTVQRLSPDFSRRETVCTGVRFTCGLAFNEAGDLFATDQEGATWLPNGNPFDELLHIEAGRHYGFPPRHPEHLPDVFDEPSVVDFGPQHQCAVGLCFNLPVNGGPTFGPDAWDGNAFVAGESRGKLYRVALRRTGAGYVGEPHVIASFGWMPVDVTVTPRGDLLVCCHSGEPDWGTGPEGPGKIFRLSWCDRDVPQPLRAWQAAPDRFHVRFDRPVGEGHLAAWRADASIIWGPHVREGDRHERFRPGYAVVTVQQAAPRHELPVREVRLGADGRTVELATDPQAVRTHYAIRLGATEIGATNTGFAAARSADGFSARLDLRGLTTPLLQAGTHVENAPADLEVVVLHGNDEVARGVRSVDVRIDGRVEELAWRLAGKAGPIRPLPPRHVVPTWVRDDGASAEALAADLARVPPELEGADRDRGREVFFSDAALCSKCHAIRGEGSHIGPDLSNSPHRDYHAVLRDIREPAAAVNHDYIVHEIRLGDGTQVVGVPRATEPGAFTVGLGPGVERRVERRSITSMKPIPGSLMPAGLAEALGPDRLRDLMAFLMTGAEQEGGDDAGQ